MHQPKPSIDVSKIQNAIDAKRQGRGFSGLKPAEKVVSLVSWAWFEIDCGGFEGFYYNSAGNHAAETVEAFKAIGATKSAKIVQRANQLFPGGTPPKGRIGRHKALQAMSGKAKKRMRDLLSSFDDGSEDLYKLLKDFMVAHAKKLGL